jgi:hypothetical protein
MSVRLVGGISFRDLSCLQVRPDGEPKHQHRQINLWDSPAHQLDAVHMPDAMHMLGAMHRGGAMAPPLFHPLTDD